VRNMEAAVSNAEGHDDSAEGGLDSALSVPFQVRFQPLFRLNSASLLRLTVIPGRRRRCVEEGARTVANRPVNQVSEPIGDGPVKLYPSKRGCSDSSLTVSFFLQP
jgi:hypothetical protein